MPTPEQGSFDQSEPPHDAWVLGLFEKHGLPPQATFEEIEPVVRTLWTDVVKRLCAIEIVMGRRVEMAEFVAAPLLERVIRNPDVDEALISLIMFRERGQTSPQAS